MSKEIEGGYADKSLIGSQIGAIPSAAVSNQFLTGLNTDGSLTRAQPSMANISDYTDSGIWVPVDASGAGLTLTVSDATYIQIGKFVICSAYILYPNTANSSQAKIGGLPFTVASAIKSAWGGLSVNSNGITAPLLNCVQNTVTASLVAASTAAITNANMSQHEIYFYVIYKRT